jgi:hypothetical protein
MMQPIPARLTQRGCRWWFVLTLSLSLAYPLRRGNRTVLQTVLYGGFGPSTAGHSRPFGMPPYVLTMSEQEVADLRIWIHHL